MARSWFATPTKIGPFTATGYHALRGTSLIVSAVTRQISDSDRASGIA